MRAFIIRPFNTKQGIDFNDVEATLIGPALEQLRITGRTTIDILKQGNIRLDMFQRLLTADLVVADLSIHNANVFYELGIRHALRDKRTFLLRARIDEFPFDLQTDRYFTYDKDAPAASLELLVAALRQTMHSDDLDSPVFRLLPGLAAQNPSRFLAVPLDFQEDVQHALANETKGDLELFATESQGFEWEREGLRLVGNAQVKLRAFEGARQTWEAIRQSHEKDLEANTRLATIYQRLRDLTRSDEAVMRVLDRRNDIKNPVELAEAYALLGSNEKERWIKEWEPCAGNDTASIDTRRAQALRSAFLKKAWQRYADGFTEDLNHYYSGLNSLALLTIHIELAQLLPEVWTEPFEDDAQARTELNALMKERDQLAATVTRSIRAAQQRAKQKEKPDVWADLSAAVLALLTKQKPARVATLYREALATAPNFNADAEHRQLSMFQQLRLLDDHVTAALGSLPPLSTPMKKRMLVFTGHRLDAPGRKQPRFPNREETIRIAREKLKTVVAEELQRNGGTGSGIGGGASGGDMLFHEVCEELGVSTALFLAVPKEQFVVASVQDAGPEWVERFYRLCERQHPVVLASSNALPKWLSDKPDYTIWQRNNLWILHHALAEVGGANVIVIALWNGEAGGGPGGTADMIQQAKARGAKTLIIDTKTLFHIEPT